MTLKSLEVNMKTLIVATVATMATLILMHVTYIIV